MKYPSLYFCIFVLILWPATQQAQSIQDSIYTLLAESNQVHSKKKTTQWYQKIIDLNEQLIKLNCEFPVLNDSTLSFIHYRLALAYNVPSINQQYLYHSLASLAYSQNCCGEQSIGTIRALSILASLYEYQLDNKEKALAIREQLAHITPSLLSAKNTSFQKKNYLLENLLVLAELYRNLEREADFINVFNSIKQFQENGFLEGIDFFQHDLLKSYGLLYFGDIEAAFNIAYKQYVIQKKVNNSPKTNILETLIIQTVLAEVYLAKKEASLAYQLYEDNKRMHHAYAADAIQYEQYFTYVGAQSLSALHRFAEAEQIIHDLLEKIEQQEEEYNHTFSPTLKTDLYECLANNAYMAYDSHKKEEGLYQSYAYSRQAQTYLKTSWAALKNDKDLQNSVIEYYEVFEVSLLSLQALYAHTDSVHYYEEALKLIELTKNIELKASLSKANEQQADDISLHFLERERSFKEELFQLKRQLEQTNVSEEQALLLQDSISELNNELLKLQDKIHRANPNYRQKSYTQQHFNLQQLEEQLQKEQQCLVYYACGKENLFTLGLSEKGRVFEHQAIGERALSEQIKNLREGIYSSPNQATKEQLQNIAHISHDLYQKLLAPVSDIALERLLVVADGPLEMLPFSMLLDELPAQDAFVDSWPFVLHKHSFSTAYAIELLLQSKKTAYQKNEVLAFAPHFSTALLRNEEERHAGSLNNNVEEVQQIGKYFKSTSYTGDAANLNTFKEQASDYSVLHLATHGVADTENGDFSHLSFSKESKDADRLYVGDLYHLHIPAEMVVLSACETAFGEWKRGEGIIGLERAFSYAGAQSLISTQWKVSDKASANIMGRFYKELAKGLPKDQALRAAQLSFMQEESAWLNHPFFWAAYIQKGNSSPLDIPSPSQWWLYGLIGLLMGLGVYFYKQHQRVRSAA